MFQLSFLPLPKFISPLVIFVVILLELLASQRLLSQEEGPSFPLDLVDLEESESLIQSSRMVKTQQDWLGCA